MPDNQQYKKELGGVLRCPAWYGYVFGGLFSFDNLWNGAERLR